MRWTEQIKINRNDLKKLEHWLTVGTWLVFLSWGWAASGCDQHVRRDWLSQEPLYTCIHCQNDITIQEFNDEQF